MIKKELNAKNSIKYEQLADALGNLENSIPYVMKRAVNFKGRKSVDIARKILSVLSEPTSVVLDCFMGTAPFVIAAVQEGLHVKACEIDNYTFSVVKTLFQKIDYGKLKAEFNQVEKSVKSAVMDLYKTQCCGIPNYISKLLFDPASNEYFTPKPNREIKNGKNVVLLCKCPKCGKRNKRFEQCDLDKINEISASDIAKFPHVKFIENSRINITGSTGADYYDRNFTNRNKKALLLLQDAILKLSASPERDVLEHALVSSLPLAKIAMYASSTDILYHVLQEGAQEMNVWVLFEEKLNALIAFKKKYSCMQSDTPEHNDEYSISQSSYQDYVKTLGKKSIDIIYTDFPYTDQVPYLERNQLYRVWLNTFYKKGKYELTKKMLDEEIVLTNAPSRPNKNKLAQYYKDIDAMFASFAGVIKDDGQVVLTIKLGKNKYFTTLMEILNLARKNGFEYVLRIGVDKNDPTLRKQSAYKNTLSNEMIIVLEKLSESNRYWYIGDKNYEYETVKFVYEKSADKDMQYTLNEMTGLVGQHIRKKSSHIVSPAETEKIASIIRENFIVDATTGQVQINGNRLYPDIEESSDLFTKLYEYIPLVIKNLIDSKGKFVLDDLYFAIANSLCTGNPHTINQFLDDSKNQSYILRLLNHYCMTDGIVYEKKIFDAPIANDAVDVSLLGGTQFEYVIRSLLSKEGYSDIVNTGGSGDLGVDLIAKRTENGRTLKYLFQCKRWVANVDSSPIQRLDSERSRRKFDAAICITTSDFTKDAKLIAQERQIGMQNGTQILEKLNLAFPGKYYNGLL